MESILIIMIMIYVCTTISSNLAMNYNFKKLLDRIERQEELLKRIEDKRENFKELQNKIEELKEKELKQEQLEKATKISINPIGFTSSTIENTIEYVNQIYNNNGLNVTYDEVVEYIKLE